MNANSFSSDGGFATKVAWKSCSLQGNETMAFSGSSELERTRRFMPVKKTCADKVCLLHAARLSSRYSGFRGES